MAIKRLHYYDQQFLVEGDFTSEQQYHLDMRRRLSRVLHTFGIAEGLDVQRTGNRQVTVKAGTAIDGAGREIVLEADQIVDLSNLTAFPGSTTVHVTIAYTEAPSDPSTATGAPGNTRVTETPVVQASTTAPPLDGTVVRLARFDKTSAGDVPGNPNDLFDGGVRQPVSAKIAPGAITDANVAAGTITGAKLAGLTVTDANLAAGAITDPKIAVGAVSETKLAAALLAKINTPAGLVSVDGVINPGGNVDLVAANAIQLTPNNTLKNITIGETHSARTDNPHATTAAQIGALLASQYEFGHRAPGFVGYTQADATGAVRTVNVGFQPRMILAFGNHVATLGTRGYGSGTFGFFDLVSGLQINTGFGITRFADTDWFIRLGGSAGVCSVSFFDNGSAPVRGENLVISLAATPTGFTTTLGRTVTNVNPLASFSLNINFSIWGA